MAVGISQGRRPDPVKQFSVLTPNRVGRLHELVRLLSANEVHILALTVLDSTDSSIVRLVVDDPDRAQKLFHTNGFPFTESNLVVVEVDSTTQLSALMAALLEAEINVNYLYSFIPHPRGKSLLALSMEDNQIAAQALQRHQFRVLQQSDISR